MRRPKLILAALLLAPALAAGVVTKELQIRIPMRDGVRLAANVFRPPRPGRYPAILVRTPYNKGAGITPNYQAFVDREYAIVVEDVRGRYGSEGVFRQLEQESEDGDDTIEWIARQAWCDGSVGMMGGSYLGMVQWKAALTGNPHLKAIFPVVSGWDDYRDRFYSPGGALRLGSRLLWMSENLRAPAFRPPKFDEFVWKLPVRSLDVVATGQRVDLYQRAMDHPAEDSYWRAISTRARIGAVRTPVFSVGGWFDNFVQSDLEAFAAISRNSSVHRIVIGPWPHNMSAKLPGVDFGPEALIPIRGLQLEWFGQWLKGKGSALLSGPPVRIFVMGVNRWRGEREWPLARTQYVPFYLHSRGKANTASGDGRLEAWPGARQAADRYTFDPLRPVPTRGGAVCCNPRVFPWGPMDQRGVERRKDVLVYSTAPLERPTEVTGPIAVTLYVATSAVDTDFTAKLVDVFPDGTARNLTDGILRLRYREGLDKPALAKPGQIYRIRIDAGVTSNVFLKNHRIRIEISSSNFPRFDRNPNTGRPIAGERRLRTAQQRVHHDREHPSHALLPIID